MDRVAVDGGDRPVEIDVCRECAGVWLDETEGWTLQQIVAALERGERVGDVLDPTEKREFVQALRSSNTRVRRPGWVGAVLLVVGIPLAMYGYLHIDEWPDRAPGGGHGANHLATLAGFLGTFGIYFGVVFVWNAIHNARHR